MPEDRSKDSGSTSFEDRRRAPRFQRLVKLSFEHSDRALTCVSTDVSLYGAFLTTPSGLHVAPGTRLTVEYRSKDESATVVQIISQVTRMITRPSRVNRLPGMAVEFLEFVSILGRDPLELFLDGVLGWPPGEDDEGGFSTDEGTGAVSFRPPQEQRLRAVPPSAKHVFEDRLSASRTLPDDPKAAEEMLKKIVTDVERRRKRRYALRTDIKYYVGDSIPHLGTVLNISERGLFIQTSHDIPGVGQKVCLRFPVTEDPDDIHYVKIEGIVRRRWDPATESLPGFGIRFETVDEQGKTGVFRLFLRRFDRTRGNRGRRRGYHYSRLKPV